jgi:hypothetical protein
MILIKFHLTSLLISLIYFTLLNGSIFADIWKPPKNYEISSENNNYIFKIIPTFNNNNYNILRGSCNGLLYVTKGKRINLAWKRLLVNDICPINAFVSNTGKYVITVGEWYYHEKLPIVIYGSNGSLINVYGKLEQILPPHCLLLPQRPGADNETRFPGSLTGINWLSRSLMIYGSNDDYFIIRLRNKDVIIFETASGQVIDEKWKYEHIYRTKELKKYEEFYELLQGLIVNKALILASSELKNEQELGIFILNQCSDKKSIKILKEIVRNQNNHNINIPEKNTLEYKIVIIAKDTLEKIGEEVKEKEPSPSSPKTRRE